MDFETRMRKVIKDLVAPVIDRAQEDRTNIFKLKNNKKLFKQQINVLEKTIFKSKETNTLFDEFDSKFILFEVSVQRDIEKILA